MNKTDIVQTIQKEAKQFTVLTLAFVGILMVFQVTSLVGEVQARFDATAISSAGTFSDVVGKMAAPINKGHFVVEPHTILSGIGIAWQTAGDGIGSGTEEGTVEANVGNYGKVTFYFYNPSFGRNTCEATADSPSLRAVCLVEQGNVAQVFFTVTTKSQSTPTIYCDILARLGNYEQTKVIREKLGC